MTAENPTPVVLTWCNGGPHKACECLDCYEPEAPAIEVKRWSVVPPWGPTDAETHTL